VNIGKGYTLITLNYIIVATVNIGMTLGIWVKDVLQYCLITSERHREDGYDTVNIGKGSTLMVFGHVIDIAGIVIEFILVTYWL
jgi:hypothetical protein